MNTNSLTLGIDVGTSSCKVVAVAEDGSVVASTSADYPIYTPQHGYSEQAPEDWWTAADASIRRLTAMLPAKGAEVTAIGMCGQMHGLVALDAANEVIRHAILWNDQRCDAECTMITDEMGGLDRVIEATNNRLITGFTAGKIRWMMGNEPESFARIAQMLNPKDYLRFRMTGQFTTEVSDASGTGLFDVAQRRWSEAMVAASGLSMDALPQVVESTESTGRLLPELAEAWNIPLDVDVYGGGGDAVIQTLSMGVTKPGDIGITLGTAGIIAAASDFCPENLDGKVQVSCYYQQDYWHIMGVSLTAAGALHWLQTTLRELDPAADVPFSHLIALAREIPAGADGLLFVPYLAGERSPHYAPSASGGWLGLTAMHGLGHLVRSLMEGVLLNMREILEAFSDLGLASDRVIASGGATRDPFWLQTMADVFGREVVTLTGAAEGGAYGAALAAGVGSGQWASMDEALAKLQTSATFVPDPQNQQTYQKVFDGHRRLYQDMAGIYEDVETARNRS